MARNFHALLAESLARVKKQASMQIIKSEQISRIDRERLLKAGALQKIVRGWYLFCQPNTNAYETTPWYINFWDFIQLYLQARFNNDYCLSPETSLSLYLGKNIVPKQIIVLIKTAASFVLQLPHNTSILVYQEKKNFPTEINKFNNLNVFPFEYALCKMPETFYLQQPQDAEIALRMLQSAEKILFYLLRDGLIQAAGRIVGGLRHLGNNDLADAIKNSMIAAGFTVAEINLFVKKPLIANKIYLKSPYALRIEAYWYKNRDDIINILPKPLFQNPKIQNYKLLFKEIDSLYTEDAYHSLSIEGYQVTEDLISKIAKGKWNPDHDQADFNQQNAMAAKGYFEAFKKVKQTIDKMVHAKDPIKILRHDFADWYLALFSSAVTVGIIPVAQLAGFRNQAVYIRNSMHVPPPYHVIPDCIDALFDCIKNENDAGVRAVLAHWLFGFIHPYNDGNGRMARFMMNALLLLGGYPWTIIHVENRQKYLTALEAASVNGDLKIFAQLIAAEIGKSKNVF